MAKQPEQLMQVEIDQTSISDSPADVQQSRFLPEAISPSPESMPERLKPKLPVGQLQSVEIDQSTVTGAPPESFIEQSLLSQGWIDPFTKLPTQKAKDDTATKSAQARANMSLGLMRAAEAVQVGAQQAASILNPWEPKGAWRRFKTIPDVEFEQMIPDPLGKGNMEYSIPKIGGEIATVFVVPQQAGATALGRIGYASGVNALLGFTEAQDPQSEPGLRYMNSLVNGALGAVFQLPVEILNINKNRAKQKLTGIFDLPENREAVARGEHLSKISGIDFSPDKLTMNSAGNADIAFQGMIKEGLAIEPVARKIMNHHVESVRRGAEYVAEVAKRLSPNKKIIDPAKLGNDIADAHYKAVDDMYTSAGETFEWGFNEAVKVSKRPFLSAQVVDDEMAKIAQQYSGRETADPTNISNIIQKEAQRVARMSQDGRLSPNQIKELAMSYNGVLSGKGTSTLSGIPDPATRRAVASQMKNALYASIKDAEEASVAPVAPILGPEFNYGGDIPAATVPTKTYGFQPTDADKKAIKLMRGAWDAYSANSEAIKTVTNTTVGELLSAAKRGDNIPYEEYFKKINKLPPSSLEAFVSMLDSTAPEVANDYRRFILENALKKSLETPVDSIEAATGKSVGLMDPDKVIKNLPEPQAFNAWFRGSHSYNDVKEMVEVINRLQISPSGAQLRTSERESKRVSTAVGMGTVGVSSIMFGVRDIVKEAWPKIYATHMLTKEGRQALKTLKDPKVSPTRAAHALAVLWGEQDALKEIGEQAAGNIRDTLTINPPLEQRVTIPKNTNAGR